MPNHLHNHKPSQSWTQPTTLLLALLGLAVDPSPSPLPLQPVTHSNVMVQSKATCSRALTVPSLVK